MTRITIIGGAGGMGRHAAKLADPLHEIEHITIADIDLTNAQLVAELLDTDHHAVRVDIADALALDDAIGDSDYVLNCAGPYYRFATPVLDACIRTRTHYLDLCDDWEPTLELLDRHHDAAAAGIVAIIGMGASPGLTNLLANLAVDNLEAKPTTLITGWIESETGLADDGEPHPSGAPSAATVHWLHQLSGTIRTLEKREFVDTTPMQRIDLDYPGIGTQPVWTVGHPETVTLPRTHATLDTCLNVMATTTNIIDRLHTVLAPVEAGTATIDDAARHLLDERTRPFTNPIEVQLPSLFAWATDNTGAVSTAHLDNLPPGGMAGSTTAPLISALQLHIDQPTEPGVHTPEATIPPERFFDYFETFVDGNGRPTLRST